VVWHVMQPLRKGCKIPKQVNLTLAFVNDFATLIIQKITSCQFLIIQILIHNYYLLNFNIFFYPIFCVLVL